MIFAVISLQAKQTAVRYKTAHGRKYVYLRDTASYYGLKCYIGKTKTLVYGRYSKLELDHDKRFAKFNNVQISLCYAPFRMGNDSFLSEKDLYLIFDPLLRSRALPKKPVGTIMIDPGHGGKDNGGSGKVLLEKNLNHKFALELKRRLQKMGYKVFMTRLSDSYVSLQRRSELCAKYKPDLFISIHGNVAKDKKVNGIETFCLAPSGVASTNGGQPKSKWEKGNRYDTYNFALAYQIQKSLIRRTKADDRGVKFSRFYVLKNATCPAVLIETGFLSNRSEEMSLATIWRMQQTAQAIVDGIISYRRMMR